LSADERRTLLMRQSTEPAPGSGVDAEPGLSRAGGMSPEPRGSTRQGLDERILPYVAIARPDHWFKNVFMVLGVLLAYFYAPELVRREAIFPVAWAVVATCLLASSNYVVNEILDAATDSSHPVKGRRPIPMGRVEPMVAYAEWLLLALAGLAIAAAVNPPFFFAGLALLLMGIIYNVPPLRSKDLAYVDVLSESVNNPIRLMLGWFAVNPMQFPPVSLLIAYWMIGAFFMASKRLAEYRSIGDHGIASSYRSSFRSYDEGKMLISMFFYATTFGLFFGVFIIRYQLELILAVPLIAGFVCYYLHVAFKRDSAAQSPERLYRERGLMLYVVVCAVAFIGLMVVDIPVLYDLFNVEPASAPALWRF
jgi:decaprenyl-phosphate phosphoribosyltransferase